jgi:hypothetical protein
VGLAEPAGGQLEEGLEGEATDVLGVEVVEDVVDELVGGCEPQTHEGALELDRVDHTAAVAVEDVKGSLDLAYLLDGDSLGREVAGIPGLLGRLGRLRSLARGLGFIRSDRVSLRFGYAHLTNNNKDLSSPYKFSLAW